MLLIDDLLMAPFKGLLFVMREVARAAEEEQAGEERATMGELAALHRSLESGQLTEDAFDAREIELLERLERLRGVESGDGAISHGP
jgi:hypothetical protein